MKNKLLLMSLFISIISFSNEAVLVCEGKGELIKYSEGRKNYQEFNEKIYLKNDDVLSFGRTIGSGRVGYYHVPYGNIKILDKKFFKVGYRETGLGDFVYSEELEGKKIKFFSDRGIYGECIGRIR